MLTFALKTGVRLVGVDGAELSFHFVRGTDQSSEILNPERFKLKNWSWGQNLYLCQR
jgi:hypothetical protein